MAFSVFQNPDPNDDAGGGGADFSFKALAPLRWRVTEPVTGSVTRVTLRLAAVSLSEADRGLGVESDGLQTAAPIDWGHCE